MSDGHAGVSRRGFLRTATGAGAASVATGTAAAQEDGEDGGDGGGTAPPDYGNWFSDVDNYGGETTDLRGEDQPTVMVGTEGNGGPNAFDPPAVHVETGTTVVFEWTGDGFHNVVADNQDWSSGDPVGEAGTTYEHTFEESGIVKYYCDPHLPNGMKGAVVVGEDYPTVDTGGGGAGPALPDVAKSIGFAASAVMAATLGLAYVFIRHGGGRADED